MNKKSSANVQIRNSSRRPRLARFVFFILNIWVPLWWARNFFHAFHFATLVHSLAHGAAAVRQCWVCFISIFFFLFSRMNMMNEMKHEKMRKFRWDSDFKINMWRVEFFFSLILCSLSLRRRWNDIVQWMIWLTLTRWYVYARLVSSLASSPPPTSTSYTQFHHADFWIFNFFHFNFWIKLMDLKNWYQWKISRIFVFHFIWHLWWYFIDMTNGWRATQSSFHNDALGS